MGPRLWAGNTTLHSEEMGGFSQWFAAGISGLQSRHQTDGFQEVESGGFSRVDSMQPL